MNYRARFENEYHERVQFRLVGKENQYSAQLNPTEWIVAEGATAIFPGPRVLIAWNDITGELLQYTPVTIDHDFIFVMQSSGIFAIGAL